MNESIFPILSNVNIIPKGSHCASIDLHASDFYRLHRLRCAGIILIHTPAEWEIRRKGTGEQKHINLFFLLSGSTVAETATRTVQARTGQLLIVPSWIDRRVWQSGANTHIYARFDAPQNFPAVRDISVRDCLDIDAVNFYVQTLLLNKRTLEEERNYRAAAAECLGILLQRELRQGNDVSTHRRTDELLRLLVHSEAEYLMVKHVAKRFGMSLSAFRKFCLTHFGQPPGMVIDEVRIARARGLLKYSELNIDDIAEQLGYADRFTFSKAFTRMTGQTPGTFRKQP